MKAPDVGQVFEAEEVDMAVEDVDIKPRIRIEMSDEDRQALDRVKGQIDSDIAHQYAQVFAIEQRLLESVRVQRPDGTFVRNPDGTFVEDWSKVTIPEMERFLQEASAWAFFSSQQAIDAYAEAVFTKYLYDDAYDEEYSRQLRGTINDKVAVAKRRTQDERWLALYKSLYHKRAQEVVKRLDEHVRRVERIYTSRVRQSEMEYRASRSY